jgi:VanZ family protein
VSVLRLFKSQAAWNHWYRRALPAYWIFLFCATHFPKLKLGAGAPGDKSLHGAAFAVLTFLFWRFAETIRRPLPAPFAWLALLILGLYAALDEYLQRFVGRTADLMDWVSNMAGIVIVLGVLEYRRRTRPAAEIGLDGGPPPPRSPS